MAKATSPVFKVEYEGKDITEDLSDFIISLSYTDNTENESDEIQITVEDSQGLWRDNWQPQKQDKIKLSIGYDDNLVPCGEFTVDEVSISGPPDITNIRALATGVNSPLRTKTSEAFESLQLKEIAQKIADKNGLTLLGEIPAIPFERVTQSRETDLEFLHRISKNFGLVFSVKGSTLVFTSIFDLESGNPVADIYKTDCKSYEISDKTISTFKQANVSYADPISGDLFQYTAPAEQPTEQKVFTWDWYLVQIANNIASRSPELIEDLYGKNARILLERVQGTIKEVSAKIKAGTATRAYAATKALEIANTLEAQQGAEYFARIGGPNWIDNVKEAYRFMQREAERAENQTALVRQVPDIMSVYNRIENQAQAELMAKAAVYGNNTKQKEGRISVIGNPLLVAGNNFNLLGFQNYSGVCQIIRSVHNFSRGGGYTTEIEFKIIDTLDSERASKIRP